jgi:hypothetical protein
MVDKSAVFPIPARIITGWIASGDNTWVPGKAWNITAKGIDSVAEVVEVTTLYIWSRDSALVGTLADILEEPLNLIGLAGFERALVVGLLFSGYDYYLVPAFNARERGPSTT